MCVLARILLENTANANIVNNNGGIISANSGPLKTVNNPWRKVYMIETTKLLVYVLQHL